MVLYSAHSAAEHADFVAVGQADCASIDQRRQHALRKYAGIIVHTELRLHQQAATSAASADVLRRQRAEELRHHRPALARSSPLQSRSQRCSSPSSCSVGTRRASRSGSRTPRGTTRSRRTTRRTRSTSSRRCSRCCARGGAARALVRRVAEGGARVGADAARREGVDLAVDRDRAPRDRRAVARAARAEAALVVGLRRLRRQVRSHGGADALARARSSSRARASRSSPPRSSTRPTRPATTTARSHRSNSTASCSNCTLNCRCTSA